MKMQTRIRQSSVRVKSGVRLVLFLLATLAIAWLSKIEWLVEVCAALSAFFAIVTLAEYWNATRLRRQLDASVGDADSGRE
jgi:hypothetical protein